MSVSIPTVLIALCLFNILAVPADAAGFAKVGTTGFTWEGIFTTGRNAAMGGSDLTDGAPAAGLWNPAPLATGDGAAVAYDHADYIADTEIHTYGVQTSRFGLRLGGVIQEFVSDSELVRTAYNPEGTGETFDIRSRIAVFSASYDLGRLLPPGAPLRWSVGAAWRHFSDHFFTTELAADGLDLGSTAAFRQAIGSAWVGIGGALTWQNVNDATAIYDERTVLLPSTRRSGLTLSGGVGLPGFGRDLVSIRLAYTDVRPSGDESRRGSYHRGVEVLILETLALRQGYNSRVGDGTDSWGVGLVLREDFLSPFTVSLDVGEMSFDIPIEDGAHTILGVRVAAGF